VVTGLLLCSLSFHLAGTTSWNGLGEALLSFPLTCSSRWATEVDCSDTLLYVISNIDGHLLPRQLPCFELFFVIRLGGISNSYQHGPILNSLVIFSVICTIHSIWFFYFYLEDGDRKFFWNEILSQNNMVFYTATDSTLQSHVLSKSKGGKCRIELALLLSYPCKYVDYYILLWILV
jgi:hypothetical protein